MVQQSSTLLLLCIKGVIPLQESKKEQFNKVDEVSCLTNRFFPSTFRKSCFGNLTSEGKEMTLKNNSCSFCFPWLLDEGA